ncbi:MAG: hypothetical protein INH37_05800, partial [Myxococcaceae bacterium]|nr:hypothetical protein [Myxococcaceae bacterium]
MKWSAVPAVVLTAFVARAAPDAGPPSCADVEQKLVAAQRALGTCTEGSRLVTAARERCEGELQDSGERLQVTQARVEACVLEQTQLCRATAVFATSLLQGTAPAVNGCVPTDTRQQLQGQLAAWSATAKALSQLDDFLSGAVDSLPRVSGQSEAERRLQHILVGRQGTPAWNRRLLIVALRLTAPDTWSALQRQGPAAIEAFFGSRGPLPAGFIEEANGEHEGPVGPAGPPLTAALRLVLSYLEVSDCENRSESTECGRARQLLELLDDTGPLIIRRRVEELWATPCDALSPDTVRAWLQEFPASGRKEKQQALADLTRAASSKLFVCYLADEAGDPSYRAWVTPRLPSTKQVEARSAAPLDAFIAHVKEGDALDRCGRAVRAMQRLGPPAGCAIDRPETLTTLSTWARQPLPADASDDAQLCQKVATLLFSGAAVDTPSSPGDEVKTDAERSTALGDLRRACDERVGVGPAFEQGLLALYGVAKELKETASASPWRLDATGTRPVERAHFEEAETYGGWLQHLLDQEGAAATLGLSQGRVEACREQAPGSRYDCTLMATLDATWQRYRRVTGWSAAGLLAAVV